ncbi:hypothetical protein EIP91_010952 [Steccherinum ochraceum]|uniref:Pentacotripeptide-repeat region of PRORP domain-containing protein n=1 Tax=Steccherinum ochraceum TaxID=92696 RepID=A0A4R0R2K2_9APHY|nr:hypothetical protein EIP91_010952 [Steccherinum ochraceum]
MAAWLLHHSPWSLSRLRLRWDTFGWIARPATTLSSIDTKHYFSTPSGSEETPSMIAIRKQPYPHSGLNLSLFEDNLTEYGVSGVAYPEVAAARSPCHILAQLVREGNYHDAARVLADLVNIGVEIEPDFIYEEVARSALLTTDHRVDVTSEQRVEDFVRWYSLIPPACHPAAKVEHSFGNILHDVLSSSPVPDIRLAVQFALISAAKGYTEAVAMRTVAFIVRYAPPSVSLNFLKRLEEADVHYLKTNRVQESEGFGRRYGDTLLTAVRVHCMAGRLDAAMAVMEHAIASRVRIKHFTRMYLLKYLQLAKEEDMLSQAVGLIKVGKKTKQNINFMLWEDQDAPELPEAPPEGAPLPVLLRYFKYSFAKGESVPTALLAKFLDSYRDTGRIRGLVALRNRAYRSSKRTQGIAQWALAEMLYHAARGNKREVLLAFAFHFHAVGIPIRATRFLIQLFKRPHIVAQGREDWATMEEIVGARYPVREAVWSSSHHTAIIWRIVVQDLVSVGEVDELYKELLAQIQIARNPDGVTKNGQRLENPIVAAHDLNTLSEDTGRQLAYTQPVPAPNQFDSAHFNVFLESYVSRKLVDRVTAVFEDMFRLGIPPSTETFTRVATGFARAGDVGKVDRLLTEMEASTETKIMSKVSAQKPQFIRPVPETYSSVIRGLMHREMYDDATMIARRLYEKGGYVSGTNSAVDSVLEDLLAHLEPMEPS